MCHGVGSSVTGELPEHAYATAVASLPGVGPSRLRALLRDLSPSAAWHRLCNGCHPADPNGRWRGDAGRADVEALWERQLAAGVRVVLPGERGYPRALRSDDEAPAVLYAIGHLPVVDAPARVAIVGTRSATRYGIGVSAQLGAELAAAGATVVSGLALGIDGAAHEGACAARHADPVSAGLPLAVVGGGLDDPYPRRHARLWRRVAETGLVLSECPVGVGNEAWRFPLRNRLLAALAHVVVVVECHAHGGSLHTVAAADRRGRPVGAVPGSIRSPASQGANGLLADGAFPVRDAADVLMALSLCGATLPTWKPRAEQLELGASVAAAVVERPHEPGDQAASRAPGGQEAGRPPGDHAPDRGPNDPMHGWESGAVLCALEAEPCSTEHLMRRTGLVLADLWAELERLAAQGLAVEVGGGWWCRQ